MSDVDQTAEAAKATIEKLDAMLRDGQELVARGEKQLSGLGVQPDTARRFADRQPADGRAEFEREVQAIQDEIDRDAPRQVATRQAKLKPSRQMV